MRTDRGNFTRGSQLIETFSLMFFAGLKPMLWALAGIFAATLTYLCWSNMGEGDWYRCAMKVYAWFWEYVKLPETKQVAVLGSTNRSVMLPIYAVQDFIPVLIAWAKLTECVTGAISLTLIGGLPLCAIYVWVSHRLGINAVAREHLRGAAICSGAELKALVKDHNADRGREQRAADLREIYGNLWPIYSLFGTRRELLRSDVYLPYTIAGIPYPWHGEQTHTFAIGTTGSGKSTIIKELVDQIRERGGKAVIFDLTGSFIETYFDPARDTILNPLDQRCPQWSIFNDCNTRAEFTAAAEALVPNDGGTSEPFWVVAARTLLIEGCIRLASSGRRTNADLHTYLMTAALPAVNRLVQNTIAAPLTDPEAARMAESIRATLNTNVAALSTLPNEGPQFSVRDWVQARHNDGSILFVSARYVDLPTVRILLTLWLDTAINAMMALPTSPHKLRLWFLFDELGALHRLPAIEKGMQTARNFGGAFLLGVHTISKLRETYGEKIADTLASLARTKVILATPDYASAQWCSQQIGSSEWQQMEQGVSYGYANVRDAVTLTNKRQIEALVMPDQIMKMRDLEGWLVFPQDLPAGNIRIAFKKRKAVASPFLQRPGMNVVAPPPDGPTPPPPPNEPREFKGRVVALPGSRQARTGAFDIPRPDIGASAEVEALGPDASETEIAEAALAAAANQVGMMVVAAQGRSPTTSVGDVASETAHDPVTGELLPEKAIRTEGVEIQIAAEPACGKSQDLAEDLTVREARQNFSRGREDDDFGRF